MLNFPLPSAKGINHERGDLAMATNETLKRIEANIAQCMANVLLKDIRLNANTSLSPIFYENDVPGSIKDYRKNDKKSIGINSEMVRKESSY